MTVTIVEFAAPVKQGTQRDKILAVLYYATHYEGTDLFSIMDIRRLLRRIRTSKVGAINIPRALASAGECVDSPGTIEGRKVWKLTDTGKAHVRQLVGLPAQDPQVEIDVSTLSALASRLKDETVREYLQEALSCLRFGALRACVVFLWSGAVRVIQSRVLKSPLADVNAALKKHDPKAREIRRIDDFAYVKESVLLLVAQELGIFDKNERQMLTHALDVRNKSGHPGKYRPGEKRVSAFVEDVTRIVF